MRLYPQVPARGSRTIAADAAVALAVLLFAWLGLAVHDAVDEVAGLGRGVQEAGSAVQRGFSDAAGAVEGAPVVGGELGGVLREAGGATGGQAVEAGREGERKVHSLADLLGWLTLLIPTGLLLQRFVPGRTEQVRKLSAAAIVRSQGGGPERERLIAMRAAFSLPYATLLRYTRDPLGDLEVGRHEALVRAAHEDAGLEART